MYVYMYIHYAHPHVGSPDQDWVTYTLVKHEEDCCLQVSQKLTQECNTTMIGQTASSFPFKVVQDRATSR